MSSIRKLIGIPFLDGGRDPSIGLDCWGLFMAVQKEFGRDVPDFDISCFDTGAIVDAYRIATEVSLHWQRVEQPEPGDAVVMALDYKMPDCIQHFGVYLAAGKFIHTLRKVHSNIASIHDQYWKTRIRGYYRWVG